MIRARAHAALAASLLAATVLGACHGPVLDQVWYEEPDERGIRVVQVVLPGQADADAPSEFNRIGFNGYAGAKADASPARILILLSDWSMGAGWLDRLSRDLVAGHESLEVWTINRRQVFLNRAPEGIAHLGRWGMETMRADLAGVVRYAHLKTPEVCLGAWSIGGCLEATLYASATPSQDPLERVDGLMLIDPMFGWSGTRDQRFVEEISDFANLLWDQGVRTAAVLNPQSRIRAEMDFALAEEAAFRAEIAPEEPSELGAQVPQLRERKWNNLDFFAWVFDRETGESQEPGRVLDRGSLATFYGIPFGTLLVTPVDGRALRPGPEPYEPYAPEDAILPFHSPGGPFEYFPSMRAWRDAFAALDERYQLGSVGWGGVEGPVLALTTDRMKAFWDAIGAEIGEGDLAEELWRAGRATAGPRFEAAALSGDHHAPLLMRRTRQEATRRILLWLAACDEDPG